MLYYQCPSQQFLSHDETEPPCFCFVLGGVLKCLSQGHKHGVGRLNPRLLARVRRSITMPSRSTIIEKTEKPFIGLNIIYFFIKPYDACTHSNYKALLYEGKPIQDETFFVV